MIGILYPVNSSVFYVDLFEERLIKHPLSCRTGFLIGKMAVRGHLYGKVKNMPIYEIQKGKAKQVSTKEFRNEKELQAFFESNLEKLLGVTFLDTEYPIGDGYIDTIGIDENGSPVVIEYKFESKDDVLAQGLFYYNWLVQNKQHFNLLVEKKLGPSKKVNWEQPRVILIAKGFDKYTQVAIQQMKNIELKKYLLYANDIFYLENVYSPSAMKPKRASEKPEQYGVEYHLTKTNQTLAEAFKQLQERIQALDGVTEQANQKSGITYRTTKSFVRFEFLQSYIDVLLREEAAQNDPQGMTEDIRRYQGGYPRRVKLRSQDQVGYVFGLVKQSHESTL